MGKKGDKAKSYIRCILFPQPMLPYIKPAIDEGKEKLMLTQHSFEATNAARMMGGANCHKSVNTVQSETDLVGMETLERSVNDRFFDKVPYCFRPTLKNTSNPVHDRMRVRLTGKVSWLSKDRSDEKQCLSVKFLIGWCEAMLTDLQAFGGGYSNNTAELLRMRAQHPNILVPESSWNDQVELMRVSLSCVNAFCIHPSAHADTFMDTAIAVAEHKLDC
jgi:hypothetical protein